MINGNERHTAIALVAAVGAVDCAVATFRSVDALATVATELIRSAICHRQRRSEKMIKDTFFIEYKQMTI